MPSAPLPTSTDDVARVYWEGTMDNGAGVFRTYMDYMPTTNLDFLDSTILNSVTSAAQTATATAFVGCLTDGCVLIQMRAESRRVIALLPDVNPVLTSGQVIDETMPSFVQTTLLKQTLTRGKKGHGRMQMPGVPESFVLGSSISTTGLTAYETLTAAIMGGFSTVAPALDWVPCMSALNVFDVGSSTWSLRAGELVTLQVRTLVGTQRRRFVGRGE